LNHVPTNNSQNRITSCIQYGYETRSFVHTCLHWLQGVTVPNSGHFIPEEQPNYVRTLLSNFFSGNSANASKGERSDNSAIVLLLQPPTQRVLRMRMQTDLPY
jgi:hypothetical protein